MRRRGTSVCSVGSSMEWSEVEEDEHVICCTRHQQRENFRFYVFSDENGHASWAVGSRKLMTLVR